MLGMRQLVAPHLLLLVPLCLFGFHLQRVAMQHTHVLFVCLSAVSATASIAVVVVVVAFTCHSQFKTVNGKSKRCATKGEHTSYKELQRKWANNRDGNADNDIQLKEGTMYLHTHIHTYIYKYIVSHIYISDYICKRIHINDLSSYIHLRF